MTVLKNRKILISLLVLFLMLAGLFFSSFFLDLSSRPCSFALYDARGKLAGAQVAADEQWRFEASEVPEKFQKAIVTFEDKRFFYHPGVDLMSIARAFSSNLKRGRIVSGGSTITMQTVRLLENHPPRTLIQKAKEAILAISLEMRLSKKKILEIYAANAPFGGNVVGLEAASWRYFNRPPNEISWAEAATLAVLPNQPALVYPGANKNLLLAKRNRLLHKMYQENYFSREVLDLSLKEPIPEKPYDLPRIAPHYLEFLKKEYFKSKNKKNKTKFYSTLDSSIQKKAARILESHSLEFDKKGIHNAALIILDTKSGNVIAYCGNTGMDGRNSKTYAVDLIQAKRSSGSTLKPFLHAAMLDSGQLLPNQLVIDVPTRIGSYHPDNNIPEYSGLIPAGRSLSLSLNIPAIHELQEFGTAPFLDLLKKMGLTTFHRPAEEYGLPLILGGGEITLFEITKAYAHFMNTAAGDKKDFPFSQGSAWLTVKALSMENYGNRRQFAFKTGTSTGYRDAWAIGSSLEYTVGVWIGNAQGNGNPELKSINTSKVVLYDIFSILGTTNLPQMPDGQLVEKTVCRHSGYLAGPDCTETELQLVPKDAPEVKSCPYCRKVSLSPDGNFQATADDLEDGQLPLIQNRFVLPPNIEYWYKLKNPGYVTLPPFKENHKSATESEISIVFPEEWATIIIPVEINGQTGEMIMQAASRSNNNTIYWDLDGEYLGSTQGIHEMSVSPLTGSHTLTITDSNGTIKSRKFTIIGERE